MISIIKEISKKPVVENIWAIDDLNPAGHVEIKDGGRKKNTNEKRKRKIEDEKVEAAKIASVQD